MIRSESRALGLASLHGRLSPAEVAVAGVGVGGEDVCAEMERVAVSRTLVSLVLGSFPRATPRNRNPEQLWGAPNHSSNLTLVTQPQVCIFKTLILCNNLLNIAQFRLYFVLLVFLLCHPGSQHFLIV